jgi:hypothetical protein
MGKATRKVNGSNGPNAKAKPMTIPHLRKAFDHIDTWVENHIRKQGVKSLVPAFQSEWKKTFRRTVDAKAAEAYLSLKHVSSPRVTKKNKTQKQKGGSALAGAPLDYMTRPGVTGTYGSFPAYISSGMLPYPQDSISASCGKVDSTPNVPVDIGSNKVGGGKTRRNKKQQGGSNAVTQIVGNVQNALEVFGNRPAFNPSPPTMGSTASMAFKGNDVAPPNAQHTVYTVQPYNPNTFTTSPTLVSQNLPTQVATRVPI